MIEIEVTPEMIAAGVDVILEYEWPWTNPEEHVIKIYRAMAVRANVYKD